MRVKLEKYDGYITNYYQNKPIPTLLHLGFKEVKVVLMTGRLSLYSKRKIDKFKIKYLHTSENVMRLYT